MFCHESLANFFNTNFQLMYYHKFSLTDIEEKMMPWERLVYIKMLVNTIEKENLLKKQELQKRGSM